MMTPDVSILIPVYNEEVYLPRCLDSIVRQTLQSWELLLVDDGSTDRSGSICDSYAARDSRIRVIHQENAGISAARNAGLAAAAGKYIGFVDSDDWIAPEMFQRLLTIAGEMDCPLVMCDARTVYADGRSEPDTITQLKSSCVLNSGDMSPELLLELAGSVCRCLYHAELLRRHAIEFPRGIKFSEDRTFNLLSIGYAGHMAYEKTAYYWRFVNTRSTVHRFHPDYFEACLNAAEAIKGAISAAWGDNDALQTAYLRQLIGGAFSAVCNYYYKTSPMSRAERTAAVRQLCQNRALRAAITRTGISDIRADWIMRQNAAMLGLYARAANLKHGR